MKIKVIKFGGSSLHPKKKSFQDGFLDAAQLVIDEVDQGWKVICVLSASGSTTDRLESEARKISKNPDLAALDMLLVTGEQKSVAIMGLALRSRNCKCVFLTGGQARIRTNGAHGNAEIESIDGNRIRGLFENHDVVVVAGFSGETNNGAITTFGRGGSDTTAIALAIATKADECEIRTDVEGIQSTNPKLIRGKARRIPHLNHETVLEMAIAGAEVVHDRAVELARKYSYPFKVLHHRNDGNSQDITVVSIDGSNDAVAIVPNLSCALVEAMDASNEPGTTANFIRSFTSRNLRIWGLFQQFSNTRSADLVMLLHVSHPDELSAQVRKISSDQSVKQRKELGAVSVVSSAMKEQPGFIARTWTILSEQGIDIEYCFTSDSRISFIVGIGEVQRATSALHDEFYGS